MIQLSPSKLSVLNNCPKCFWLANTRKINRPRGIFPSLPGGIDRKMKVYFDKFRGSLPPEIEGKVEGKLMTSLTALNRWRNWRTGLTYADASLDVKLIGALDDCLTSDDGAHIPFDYKTKGSEPKDDGSQYYQTQLDCYELMLSANGYKTCGKSYLCYVWPNAVFRGVGDSDSMGMDFGVKIYEIATSVDRAKKLIEKAVNILNGDMPQENPDCEYCQLVERRRLL